ncbi:MAG: galactose mutarotase [Propionibacteriaceae bacterium]|jgi:aldose 1-epimerase|nr:galactose mutarotase [Propionibacteriaceae bacterium]
MQDTYWLRNDAVALEIARIGASLHRFEVAGRNIVLSRPDPKASVPQFVGSTCGRFANRIHKGQFSLDGQSFQLDLNWGDNSIHGGTFGFSELYWDAAEVANERLVLSLVSEDGDMGYPGRLSIQAIFTLLPSGLQVEYVATTDAPTVISVTLHPYFNLKGDGVGDINDHLLQVNSSAYTPVDGDGVPTGEIADTRGGALDFRTPRKIGPARGEFAAAGLKAGNAYVGYDHNFVLDGEGLRDVVILTSPDGLELKVRSDSPAAQIYDGDHFDGSQLSPEGKPYIKNAGLAIEPQNFPDAPNHANFPSPVLRPGETYHRTIQYVIES